MCVIHKWTRWSEEYTVGYAMWQKKTCSRCGFVHSRQCSPLSFRVLIEESKRGTVESSRSTEQVVAE